MVKNEAATKRLFDKIFICKNCKTKVKTTMSKILQGKISCKRCGSKAFRPLRKK